MARGGKRTGAGRPKTVYRVELTPDQADILYQYLQVYNQWLTDNGYDEVTTAEDYLQTTIVQQLRRRTFDPYNTPPPVDQADDLVDQESEVLP